MQALALAFGLSFLQIAWGQAAKVPDTLEQRLLACAACHGKLGEGLKANEYYPGIAGKPAGYLFNQLLNFREGRRHSPAMRYLVAFLSDEYLREIAAHYAGLQPVRRQPDRVPATEALGRGEALMLKGDAARRIPACVACHGKALTGVQPAIPGLVGLDPQYISAQMGAWRNKLRRAQAPDCMARIAGLLEPGDIPAIAAWLAARPVSGTGAAEVARSAPLPMECGGVP